jgi:hypothetical protein
MYHTTGFTKDEIIDLCALVRSAGTTVRVCYLTAE